MAENFNYALPRAVVVLICWGATYWILTALSTHLPPTLVYVCGLAWLAAGIAIFGYLYRLRRELGIPVQMLFGAWRDFR